MALRSRRLNSYVELWCLVASGGLDIWVSLALAGWPPEATRHHNLTKSLILLPLTLACFNMRHPVIIKRRWLPNSSRMPEEFRLNFKQRRLVKSDWKWKWQSYEKGISWPFPVIFSPTALITSPKLRIFRSFWCAQSIKILIGSKAMT